MLKTIVPFLLTLLFVTTFALPTVVHVLNIEMEKSVFMDVSEEEEEKNSEKQQELEVILNVDHSQEFSFNEPNPQTTTSYYSKTYQKPHLNLKSPPPDSLLT